MKVLVTGGTGFVGTSVVNRLLQRGHAVAVLARDPRKTRNRYNHPVETVAGNVLDPASLAAAVAGRDAVVHLVGIIHEKGDQTFDRMHREATENVIAAADGRGREALPPHERDGQRARTRPPSTGERRPRARRPCAPRASTGRSSGPRSSSGPATGSCRCSAPIVRSNPGFIPVIGPGTTRFQPVAVSDVARRLRRRAREARDRSARPSRSAAPQVLTLNEMYREIAAAVGKPGKPLLHLPLWYGRILARRASSGSRAAASSAIRP